MEVIVDGIIYQLQAHGGIPRIFSEVLPRMCEIDESLHITLLMTGKRHQQALPCHPHIHTRTFFKFERFLRPHWVWGYFTPSLRQLLTQLSIGRTGGKIWHSTYFTMPGKWSGGIVVTVADMIHELFPDLFNRIGDERVRQQKRRCVLGADAVICISETTRRDLQHFYGIDSDKVWAVPLSYSDTFKRLPTLADKGEPPVSGRFILYVGRRAHYKNFGQLIQAYSLWQHRREVSLVVVGGKWSPDEMKTLMGLGIYDRVRLFDKVDDEALCYLYNRAVAFVCPSLYEGFGIPLLEAMACGCPVVASRIPSTIEVTGDCPIYFDLGKTEDLLLALDKVLLEGRDSQRSLAGLERVKDFSWERTAEQVLTVYRSLGNST